MRAGPRIEHMIRRWCEIKTRYRANNWDSDDLTLRRGHETTGLDGTPSGDGATQLGYLPNGQLISMS